MWKDSKESWELACSRCFSLYVLALRSQSNIQLVHIHVTRHFPVIGLVLDRRTFRKKSHWTFHESGKVGQASVLFIWHYSSGRKGWQPFGIAWHAEHFIGCTLRSYYGGWNTSTLAFGVPRCLCIKSVDKWRRGSRCDTPSDVTLPAVNHRSFGKKVCWCRCRHGAPTIGCRIFFWPSSWSETCSGAGRLPHLPSLLRSGQGLKKARQGCNVAGLRIEGPELRTV